MKGDASPYEACCDNFVLLFLGEIKYTIIAYSDYSYYFTGFHENIHMRKVLVWVVLLIILIQLEPNIAVGQQKAMDSIQNLVFTAKNDTVRGIRLLDLAYLYSQTKNTGMAESLIDSSLKLGRRIRSKRVIAGAIGAKGIFLSAINKPQEALGYFWQALPLQEEIGDKSTVGAIYHQIGKQYSKLEQNDTALIFLKKALFIREEGNFDTSPMLIGIGMLLNDKGEYKEALLYFDKSLRKAKEKNNPSMEAKTYSVMASVFKAQGNHAQALERYFKALRMYEAVDDKVQVAQLLSNIGTLYNANKQDSLALEYHLKALKIREEIGNKKTIGSSLFNVSVLYSTLGDRAKSLSLAQRGLKLSEETNDKSYILSYLTHIANQSIEQAKPDPAKLTPGLYNDAIAKCEKALTIATEIQSKEDIIKSYQFIAEINRTYGYSVKAVEAVEQAVRFAEQLDNPGRKRTVYWLASQVYEDKKEVAKSLDYYKRYHDVYASVFEKESRESMNKLQVAYETERKENDIQMLTNERAIQGLKIKEQETLLYQQMLLGQQREKNLLLVQQEREIQDLELVKERAETAENEKQLLLAAKEKKLSEMEVLALQRQQQLQGAIIARQTTLRDYYFLAFAAFISFGMFAAYHIHHRRKTRLTLLRTNISKDLHDEIGTTLSGIGLYSEMANAQLQQANESAARESLEIISLNSRAMISTMSDIVWTINPTHDTLGKILSKLELFAREITTPKNIALHFDYKVDLRNINVEMPVRKNIYLICKEAITNAVKYSDCKNLYFRFLKHDGRHMIIIEDDGKGFDTEMVNGGNGVGNIHHRARQIKANVKIQSAEGKGTRIELAFKNHLKGG
jgi:two-component system, NarL family, sensor histidine kinase UhpB